MKKVVITFAVEDDERIMLTLSPGDFCPFGNPDVPFPATFRRMMVTASEAHLLEVKEVKL